MIALNTFSAPFKLVFGYFFVSLFWLGFSLVIFCFKAQDLIGFNRAGFFHAFLVGFVISVIIGALYQLTSVILQKEFFSTKGAFVNLFIYTISLSIFICGFLGQNLSLINFGASGLFLALFYFASFYCLSFYKAKALSISAWFLLFSSFYLFIAIFLGALGVCVLNGYVAMDFTLVLNYHIYFVLGFIFFVILGAGSTLLPMFALVHKHSFTLLKLSAFLYILAGAFLFFKPAFAYALVALGGVFFAIWVFAILKNRVRRALDYWSLNLYFCIACLFVGLCFLDGVRFIFVLFFGFLYPFILAHFYKILPFLIWYHYISPFASKTKVPLLDDMLNKPLANFCLALCVLGIIFCVLNFLNIAAYLLLASVFVLFINVYNIMKFTHFKG